MENENIAKDLPEKKKRNIVPALCGIVIIAFVIVAFTGKTYLGAFLTYSFAFLFGSLFPLVLALIVGLGVFLIVNGKVSIGKHLISKILLLLILLLTLSLCSSQLISQEPSLPLNDLYMSSMARFSSSLIEIEHYENMAQLGGGYIGTAIFYLLSSLTTVDGAVALSAALLAIFAVLFLFKPLRSLFRFIMKKRGERVYYTSPYQKDDEEEEEIQKVEKKKEKKKKEEPLPDLDPELSKPFSDSWYTNIEEKEESIYGRKNSIRGEESLLTGYVPENEPVPFSSAPKAEKEVPNPDSFLSSPVIAKRTRKKESEAPVIQEKETPPVETVPEIYPEEEIVSAPLVEDKAPVLEHEEEKKEPEPWTPRKNIRITTVEAPQAKVYSPEIAEIKTEKRQPSLLDSYPASKLETRRPPQTNDDMIGREPPRENKVEKKEPLFEEAPIREEDSFSAPEFIKKEIPREKEELASRRAEEFKKNSLQKETTFDIYAESRTTENPLLKQQSSAQKAKVYNDSPLEFMVDGVNDDKEEEEKEEEEDPAIIEQRYFEQKMRKKQEEEDRKKAQKEAEKAKVFKYVHEEEVTYDYPLPDDTMLEDKDDSDKLILNNEAAQEKAKIINKVFEDFKIQGKAISFTLGASVTRFNIQMEPGVKSDKINSVLNELQIALNGDKSVRIETVVEGRTTSGIEIGNTAPMAVPFKEAFQEVEKYPDKPLLLPIGKDISGKIITYSLDEMPHLLVAGTTGSGKSVLVQSFIMTLIMRNYPNNLKLMLIDPKQVEFARYNLESHLYCPVISDASSAIVALQKLCAEMVSRYDTLKSWGVVKISEYYEKRKGREDIMKEMPQIVCVIDEFADLMQTGGNEVAEYVQRLSQMARAAGIYLIIATQRPSKDVIPMVVKSNIACRIGLSCSTWIDSKVILDETGAETLLGKGDLLFRDPKKKSLIRAQSPYVSNNDIDNILSYIKEKAGDPCYSPDFLDLEVEKEDPGHGKMEGEGDLYEECKDFVMKTGICSKTSLIRNFSLSYSKADQFLVRLRNEGIIQPIQGNKNVVIQRRQMEE